MYVSQAHSLELYLLHSLFLISVSDKTDEMLFHLLLSSL